MFESLPIVHPSFIEPDNVMQISQKSAAFMLLPNSELRVKLSPQDLYVYIKKLKMRSSIGGGQSTPNQLSGPTFETEVTNTATYNFFSRAQYNHHDTAAAGMWDVALPEAYRLATRQTFAQNARDLLLYGMNPSLNEGLLNGIGVTSVNLPPDSNLATTFSTYDAGQFATFILGQIANIRIRMFLGGQPGNNIIVIGPQRIMTYMMSVNVVQLVNFQRDGAGSTTTSGMIQDILTKSSNSVAWGVDDTLIGKGAGGTDAIVLCLPKLTDQTEFPGPNTNEFARLSPGFRDCTAQYADMVVPREITTPVAGGVVDVMSERRISPGWAVRPEAITILNVAY